MSQQVKPVAKSFLPALLCGFQKCYNTQHVLLKFLGACKITIDNGGCAGALLVDPSKAFKLKYGIAYLLI